MKKNTTKKKNTKKTPAVVTVDRETIGDACNNIWCIIESLNNEISRLENAGVSDTTIARMDDLVEPLSGITDYIYNAYCPENEYK